MIKLALLSVILAAMNIWPGSPPGTEQWTQKERVIPNTPLGTVIFNVVTPTITPYLPDPGKATGMGVIIAPGGACAALPIELEGTGLASWLQQRGIAAFILKYRIPEKKQQGIPDQDMDVACKYGMADAVQAIKVVRAHAAQWHLSPHKIGVIGFSAGGMVVSGALLQPDLASRPDFAAFIYGAPFGKMPSVPSNLPPAFLAWAADDPIALHAMERFYAALRAAGDKPHADIFASGGHGFGTKKHGTPSDRWMDDFYSWLQSLSS